MTVQQCLTCRTVFGGETCPKCVAEFAKGSGISDVPDAGTSLKPAETFGGFQILDRVGSGAMGIVYKARQIALDRTVALKILPAERVDNVHFQGRFEREAKALAALNHPNIVTVYEFGRVKDVYYLAMEYVDGIDLRGVMWHGPLPPAQALAIAGQICDALDYAHRAQVIHRDIKPENVLVDKQGKVKVADFGLAKFVGTTKDEFSLTQSGVALGTAKYMAPEQMEGAHAVDHRADLYALGVVLYEMLTGGLPVGRFDPPSKQASVDARLDAVVMKALEKDPDRRYASASEIKTDLTRVGEVAQPRKANRWPVFLAAAALAMLVVGLGVWKPWKRSTPVPAEEKIDGAKLLFGTEEGPLGERHLELHPNILNRNPLIARDGADLEEAIRYLRTQGLSSLDRGSLTYAYIVVWHSCRWVVLESKFAERLEAEVLAGGEDWHHWVYRRGSILVFAFGSREGLADFVPRVRKRLGLSEEFDKDWSKGKIDASEIEFWGERGPLDQEFSARIEGVEGSANPLVASGGEVLEQIAQYLTWSGIGDVDPQKLRYGCIAAWPSCVVLILECAGAESVERQFIRIAEKKGKAQWTFRREDVVILLSGQREAVDALSPRIRRKLGFRS